MKYEDIKKSLQQVMQLVEQCEHDGASAIEYDLMLNKLRDIYASVRFELQPAAATSATTEEEVAELKAEEAVPAAAVVIAEPVVTVEPQEEQPQTETEPKEEEQPAEQELQPEPEPEQTVQNTDEEQEPETEEVAEVEPEHSAEEAEEPEAPVFFKSDEETQNRRRMIVRSLYDDAPVSEPTEHPATAEQAKDETPEAIAECEPTAETDQSAEENSVSVADTLPEEPKEEHPEVAEVAETTVVAEVAETEVEETDNKAPAAEEPACIEKAEEPAKEVEEHHFAAESATEHVLGEVINANVQTFADTISPAETAAADIVGKGAIDDLSAAIGINDRFLMIRDLFDGNSDAYNAAVQKLNSFGNLNDCMVYIVENFEWNPYCDGAKLMMSLIERRYAHNQ